LKPIKVRVHESVPVNVYEYGKRQVSTPGAKCLLSCHSYFRQGDFSFLLKQRLYPVTARYEHDVEGRRRAPRRAFVFLQAHWAMIGYQKPTATMTSQAIAPFGDMDAWADVTPLAAKQIKVSSGDDGSHTKYCMERPYI
jgi:hypothetical protein